MEVEFIRHVLSEVHSHDDTLECYCMRQTFYGEKIIAGSLRKKINHRNLSTTNYNDKNSHVKRRQEPGQYGAVMVHVHATNSRCVRA